MISEKDLSVIDLSVILISKNQAWNIARLIESVLAEISDLSSEITTEIVLVDSVSRDHTIEIARQYPVDIIRLHENQRLTAHKGRYAGYKHTRGSLILFLDGDMELCKGWLHNAFDEINCDKDTAAISGPWINLPLKPPQVHLSSGLPRNVSDRLALYNKSDISWAQSTDKTKQVSMIGGAGMYKRKILEQVGFYNVGFFSDEEPELCIRIRQAGYHILRTTHPIAYHYSEPLNLISTLWLRRRRNLFLGYGQIMRYHLGTRFFWPYLKERGFGCVPVVGVAIGLISLLWLLSGGSWIWFVLWISGIIVFILIDIIRKRSLYKSVYSMIKRLIMAEGTIRGFFKPANSENNVIKADVIQRAEKVSG
jgi:glycosyltransferase involved in cell wall biosynthesis